MKSRLENLYTYLVETRKHELKGWYNSYKSFVKELIKIRTALASSNISDKETYADTSFYKNETPVWHFLSKLFANTANGIAANGQSIISKDNFKVLYGRTDFIETISNLIKEPSFENHTALRNKWHAIINKNNPVLTNRATAACTTKVSTTVDEGKFNHVFWWLQKEGLIEKYTGDDDWYHKNMFLVEKLTQGIRCDAEIDEFWINVFIWELWENIANPFSLKKQVVKFGAPGTGKTYISKQTAKLQYDIWNSEFKAGNNFTFDHLVETVQFHPSYSYEDFMEGLRPITDDKGEAQLKLHNGVFKSFCIDAGKWERDIALINIDLAKKWERLTIKDVLEYKGQLNQDYWEYIFKNENTDKKLSDAVPPYFIIIDEINRAELSRVFGELMYCLEYRGIEGAIKTQYAMLNDKDTGMIKLGDGYKFFIPHNVYILGTMNTIDRSVESFDFALRRRFRWEEVKPSVSILRHHLQEYAPKWISLADNLSKLNTAIKNEPLLGKEYCIGHAYFWNLPYYSETSVSDVRYKVWDDSISSLLEEYLRGTGREDLLNHFAKEFGL